MPSLIVIALVLVLAWVTLHFVRDRVSKRSHFSRIWAPPSQGFIMGNLGQLYSPLARSFLAKIDKGAPSAVKLHGYMGDTQLYVVDAYAVSQIVSHPEVHAPTDLYVQGNTMVFGKGLLSTLGPRHKKQRKMMSPAFSASALRDMFPIVHQALLRFRSALEQEMDCAQGELDMLRWSTKAALEIVGLAGLGHSFDTFNQDPEDHPYSKAIHDLVPEIFSLFAFRQGLTGVIDYIPRFISNTFLDNVPWPKVRRIRRLKKIVDAATWGVYTEKLELLKSNDFTSVGHGKDILSVTMKMNARAPSEDKLSEEEILGQISTLIFTATDTAAGAMARALAQLAGSPCAQQKLRSELLDARKAGGGKLSYDAMQALPYLDAVCRESLRLGTAVPMLTRTTKMDTILNFSKPIVGTDGEKISTLHVPNNTNVVVSLRSMNRNPEFKPERWSNLPDVLLEHRLPGLYTNLMTFSGGPKGCIAFKFMEMELKATLATLIEAFEFNPSDDQVQWYMKGIEKPGLDVRSPASLPLKIRRVDSMP
ncbi:cytochrome P450 [Hymenopellis radicata]|nr:cytochrome P450 [Hymenopellis radicata]